MEPGGSMLHSQGLSNNPYPGPNQCICRLEDILSHMMKINIITLTNEMTDPTNQILLTN